MEILYGKKVAEYINSTFDQRLSKIRIKPKIAVLGIKGDNVENVYIKTIQKNCIKYGIGFEEILTDNIEDFKIEFERVKADEDITGMMFAQPVPKELEDLIIQVPSEKDIEGISITNKGKLFIGKEDAILPCTSKAIIKTLEYYKIDCTGKKVVVVGRSNIVGKPLAIQLLEKNATVTICHSKTQNLKEETSKADIVVMAIGKSKFLKKQDIKQGAILIDVGINVEKGNIVGDIDFDDVKERAKCCTPVPGGIGVVTNAILIDNIIKCCEKI